MADRYGGGGRNLPPSRSVRKTPPAPFQKAPTHGDNMQRGRAKAGDANYNASRGGKLSNTVSDPSTQRAVNTTRGTKTSILGGGKGMPQGGTAKPTTSDPNGMNGARNPRGLYPDTMRGGNNNTRCKY